MICRSCQYAYPRDSESCPKCGRKNPGTPAIRRLRIAAIVLGLVAATFLYYLLSRYDQFSGVGNKPFPPGTNPSDASQTSEAKFK